MSREELGGAPADAVHDDGVDEVPTALRNRTAPAGTAVLDRDGDPAGPADDAAPASGSGPADDASPSGTDVPEQPGPAPPPLPRLPLRRLLHEPLRWPLQRPLHLARRRSVAVVAAAAVVGAAVGWTGAGAWQDTPAGDRVQAMSAVVVSSFPTDDAVQRVEGDLRIRVTNIGEVAVDVVGSDASFDAGTITGIEGLPRRVDVGGAQVLTVHVSAACASPQPLRLAGLSVRGPDGVRRPLPVEGASDALARFCSADAEQPVIAVTRATEDGDRMRLDLTVPSGRTTSVVAVLAGSVPLRWSPVPMLLDGQGRTVWLTAPADCDPRWRATGLPVALDLVTDMGGAADLTLPVGLALPRWLGRVSCGGTP